jgi:hypothetical protein
VFAPRITGHLLALVVAWLLIVASDRGAIIGGRLLVGAPLIEYRREYGLPRPQANRFGACVRLLATIGGQVTIGNTLICRRKTLAPVHAYPCTSCWAR